jgi:hypothetical protein
VGLSLRANLAATSPLVEARVGLFSLRLSRLAIKAVGDYLWTSLSGRFFFQSALPSCRSETTSGFEDLFAMLSTPFRAGVIAFGIARIAFVLLVFGTLRFRLVSRFHAWFTKVAVALPRSRPTPFAHLFGLDITAVGVSVFACSICSHT